MFVSNYYLAGPVLFSKLQIVHSFANSNYSDIAQTPNKTFLRLSILKISSSNLIYLVPMYIL